MGIVRDRWKLSFRRSLAPSSASLPPPSPPPPLSSDPPDPPPEFCCPISGAVMADPVILPSGETFERACIEACRDLSVSLPSLSIELSSALLIHNSALRSAILRWCDAAGVSRPLPLSSSDARGLVRLLLPASDSRSATTSSPELPAAGSPRTSSSSSSYHSSSSYSSSEITVTAMACNETLVAKSSKCSKSPKFPETLVRTTAETDPLEEMILPNLRNAKVHDQESLLNSLLEATRESSDRRLALCSPRLLVALRPFLLSNHSAVKTTAIAVVVNLSLEPANKIRVVRSGAVPAIIDALHLSSPAVAREHAAGAVFSLALEEQNRTAIGVLGAVPPLLRLFCADEEAMRARVEAGMALHYLGLAEINKAKLARIAGAVKGLMGVAKGEERELRRVALLVMAGLVECKEGRAAMLDGGAVEGAVALLREAPPATADEDEGEMLVRILYGMSLGGMRFRGVARRAGAEEMLQRAAEAGEGEVGEMAMVMLRGIRGEGEREMERLAARILWGGADADEEWSGASETVVSSRRVNRNPGSGSCPNSAGF